MPSALLRRGLTWFVRFNVPQERWADVGRAMGSRSGIKREIVRTLETTDVRTAERRRPDAIAAITRDIDDALSAARLKPLTDWTGAWMERAVAHRETLQEHGNDVVSAGEDEAGHEIEETARSFLLDAIENEAETVRRRRGDPAARRFLEVATGQGMTIAQGARKWLAEEALKVRAGTVASHEAAFRRLEAFLSEREGFQSLEGVALSAVSRRMAGEVLEARRAASAWETVMRDFSAYSGLWRWAVRRGHVDLNPWADQTAGMKAKRPHDAGQGQERAYSAGELVRLLRAGPADLAPARGGYAATFWDLIRLSLLTGGRASEVLGLRVGDVLEDGTAVVLAAEGGKTGNAARIMPLHPYAQRVLADRLASLPDRDSAAPLWPEVPATGRDKRRSKVIANRYPKIRRRILGDSAEVDWHSFRRSFLTACETAMHSGGRINPALVALLAGHQRGGLAFDLYSDWSRIGRGSFRGQLGDRLRVLREAVEDAVGMGLDEVVMRALEETAEDRPVVVRVKPAFRR